MASSEVVASGVRALYMATAVDFEDGHTAVFTTYPRSTSEQSEGLRSFMLITAGLSLVRYNGLLEDPESSDDEHRFEWLDPNYSPERVAQYWEVAARYVSDELRKHQDEGHPPNAELELHHATIEAGSQDLDRLKHGLVLLP